MKQNFRAYAPLALLFPLATAPVQAGDLSLPLPEGVEVTRTESHYQCDSAASLQVQYVTAGSISLAIMKVDGRAQVFAQVLSGSGARYASGPYLWWIKGDEGSLQDLRNGADAKAIACKAVS